MKIHNNHKIFGFWKDFTNTNLSVYILVFRQ